ncbi:MAG: glycosyltransferase [bacterium]
MPERSMKLKYFLILSASGGAGHLRAGEALHQTAQRLDLPIRTQHYDCLDFTTKIFKKLYSGSYLNLINHMPELWGYMYSITSKKPMRKQQSIRIFDHLNYTHYLKYLQTQKPDAILCTHFLPYISIAERIRNAGIHAPIFSITTDFDVHQLWINAIVNHYYVYNDESAWQLSAKGVSNGSISALGIPLMPAFTSMQKKHQARKSFDLLSKNFTILLLSGGFGTGRLASITKQVVTTLQAFSPVRYNLLVVCGKNNTLMRALEEEAYPSNICIKIFGYTDTIDILMDAADLIISKSGGLTSAEAMAKRVPMIIVDPIPGQETRNAEVIIEYGAGWQANDLSHLSFKLTRILKNPSILQKARQATRTLAKPNAAIDILQNVFKRLC